MHTGLSKPRFNTFRSPPRPLLGLSLLCAALLVGPIPQGVAAAQHGSEVSLKLDRDMVPILGTQAKDLGALASSRHASELQSRLLKLRDRITALNQANVEGAKQLSEREQFVDQIRALVRKQEELVNSLREEIRRSAARVSTVPVGLPQAAPSPAPAAATSSSPIRLGPIELPAGLEKWVPEGVLGVVIVLLLIMTLHFRSYAKSKDAELAELADFVMPERGAPAGTQVDAPAGDEDQTEIKARIEDVSVDPRSVVEAPPPKLEAAPVASEEDAASVDSAMEKMEETVIFSAMGKEGKAPPGRPDGAKDSDTLDEGMRPLDEIDRETQQGAAQSSQDDSVDVKTADFFNLIAEEDELIGDEAVSPSADATGSDQGKIDWTKTVLGRKAAGPEALKEVDTLIAFEDYEKAKLLLEEIMKGNPSNPEYRLRMLHLEATSGDKHKADIEEKILSKMMEGPMSDTIYRIKEIGRGLLPGHPLFDDAETMDEAKRLLDEFDWEERDGAAEPPGGDTVESDTVDFFNLIGEEDELPPGAPDGGEGEESKNP